MQMDTNNTFCTTTLLQIRQSSLWQVSTVLIIAISAIGVMLNVLLTFLMITASQFDTVSRHLLVLCSSVSTDMIIS